MIVLRLKEGFVRSVRPLAVTQDPEEAQAWRSLEEAMADWTAAGAQGILTIDDLDEVRRHLAEARAEAVAREAATEERRVDLADGGYVSTDGTAWFPTIVPGADL